MYKKEFEIRWSDVDANGHLANSAYVNYMSHTRVGFLNKNGFSLKELVANGLGPVMFSEQIYYFKESFLGQKLMVTLEVSGLSEDGMFFTFEHNFYNEKGNHLATCDMMGAWIDLKRRQLTALPEHLQKLMEQFPKTETFKILTKADTRASGKRPKHLS